MRALARRTAGRGERLLAPWSAVFLLLVSVAALVGCDPLPQYERLGVSLDPDGSVLIHYVACESEEVAEVRLVHIHEDTTNQGDDEVLWQIESSSGTQGGTFRVGRVPEGFTETVPFPGTYPTDSLLAAVDFAAEGAVGPGVVFSIADLTTEEIWTTGSGDNEGLSPQAFEARARATCRTDA